MPIEPYFKFSSRTTDVVSRFAVGAHLGFVYHTWGTAFSGHRAFGFVAAVTSFCVGCSRGGQKLFVVCVHDLFYIVSATITYFNSFTVEDFVQGVMFREIDIKNVQKFST